MIDFDRDYTLTINGESHVASRTFEVVNPADRTVIAQVPNASQAQLDAAVGAARAVRPGWSAAPLAERQRLRSPWLMRSSSAQLEAGTVRLNEVHQYSPHQAFGGHKESGIGCENSLRGLMEYTNWQTITLNEAASGGAAGPAA